MPKLKNPRHERFCHLYYAGPEELRGNAKRCYAKCYPNANANTAQVEGSRLLSRDKVRARIEEIRDEVAEKAKARARDWWELYPDAQRTLLEAARGDFGPDMDDQDKRSAVEAAKEIVSRCEGTPQQVHEHRLSGSAGLVVVAGPDHREVEGEEEPAHDPRLSAGPRIIEGEAREDGA